MKPQKYVTLYRWGELLGKYETGNDVKRVPADRGRNASSPASEMGIRSHAGERQQGGRVVGGATKAPGVAIACPRRPLVGYRLVRIY